jgi:hypothetical protein
MALSGLVRSSPCYRLEGARTESGLLLHAADEKIFDKAADQDKRDDAKYYRGERECGAVFLAKNVSKSQVPHQNYRLYRSASTILSFDAFHAG